MNSQTQTFETEPTTDAAIVKDIMVSVLIVSVVVNLFVFSTWIALQVTSRYDGAIAQVLSIQ